MDSKICGRCKIDKPLSNFDRNKAKKDGLQAVCKECRRIHNHNYYKNSPEQQANRQATNLANRSRNAKHVAEYLLSHPCVDCGEGDLIVLDFDHVRGVKENNISALISFPVSIEKIDAEIAKCEVRCANCHRRVTAQRAGWSKLSYVVAQELPL